MCGGKGITGMFDNVLTGVLGKDIGGFLGSQGVGRAIENWSNPITQLSGRNPILNLVQGTGDWRGASSAPSKAESTLNEANKIAASIYGGAYLGGGLPTGGGAEGVGSGLGAGAQVGATEGMGLSPLTAAGQELFPEVWGTGMMGAPIYGTGTAAATAPSIAETSSIFNQPTQPSLVSGEGSLGLTPTGTAGEGYSLMPSGGGGSLVPAAATGSKSLLGGYGKYLPYLIGGGSLLNAAGNYMNAGQIQSGQEAYRNATSWTPDRANAYMANLQNLIGGLYSTEEQKRKKSIAEAMASAGRGGGGYGAGAEKLGRERRELAAKALAQGQLEVSKPPNQPLEAFVYPSWGGKTLTDVSGMFGQGSNALLTYAMLSSLFGG